MIVSETDEAWGPSDFGKTFEREKKIKKIKKKPRHRGPHEPGIHHSPTHLPGSQVGWLVVFVSFLKNELFVEFLPPPISGTLSKSPGKHAAATTP
jgi:hypothetical protein